MALLSPPAAGCRNAAADRSTSRACRAVWQCPDLLQVGAPLPRRTAVPQPRRPQTRTLPAASLLILGLSFFFRATPASAQAARAPESSRKTAYLFNFAQV